MMKDTSPVNIKKIAIIHDWLTAFAGSEKVVEQLLRIFPHADLFSLIDVLPARDRKFLARREVRTSFLQKIPSIAKYYRSYLPLMPMAVERFDLAGYDIVISNCHAVSKGVRTSPRQFHISYIHTPIRYAWDMEQDYLELSNLKGVRGMLARTLLYYIRAWDRGAARRPNQLLASSQFAARRITRAYRRDSTVIYPPVNTEFYKPGRPKEDFYITISRLVPYKRIDLIIKAFHHMPDKKLIVIGDGPEAARIRDLCTGNVLWLGYQPDDVLRDHLQRARAFLFAAREDFGILPVEAQACGTPVIAFGEGGATETVLGPESETPTGIFFQAQTTHAICEAVREFERRKGSFSSEHCRRNAERFSIERFEREFRAFVIEAWENHKAPARSQQNI